MDYYGVILSPEYDDILDVSTNLDEIKKIRNRYRAEGCNECYLARLTENQFFDCKGINLKEAIRNFNVIYPEFTATVVGPTNDGNKAVIFVGDGYHAITNNTISVFYDDIEKARRD